tara:strand:- start:1001 stop:1570 length:570 start_codon:yes stop_codon:yes gene_type:complete
MKILVSGNPKQGVAQAIDRAFIVHDITYCSRENGYDLTTHEGQQRFAYLTQEHDVVIICSALWKFQQTVLLDVVAKKCNETGHKPHIVCIGSTTDRVKKGGAWLYNAEKKALRDYCNTHAINGVWGSKSPKVTLISFGTLSNNQHKHPDRKCLDIAQAGEYIKWVVDQPRGLSINEISIDPMQGAYWHG